MKKIALSLVLAACSLAMPAQESTETVQTDASLTNINRAMALLDATMSKCFTGTAMRMGDVYNLETKKSEGTADVWPYTAALEATNSVMEALTIVKDKYPELYEANFKRYKTQMSKLYSNLDYYKGTYTLTSYTQTHRWSVYGVHRGSSKGNATVTGIENVYDDQMWIIRELVRAYKNTGEKKYLTQAEYLTEYVVDGWDCALDDEGNEYGGISWGPGYNSKHSCSNAPIVSPLVWLAEIYKDKDDETTYRYIDLDDKRKTEQMKKYDYYLTYAKKVYAWQKEKLLNSSTGVYWDMLGADNTLQYETVDGERYRKHVDNGSPSGTAYTYNSGTMLCGATDLYRVTGDEAYLKDLTTLAYKTYIHFRGVSKTINGKRYYPFPYDKSTTSGFNAWFDDVLLRAYVVSYGYENSSLGDGYYSALGCDCFQNNLDYAYENYLQDEFLPINMLGGWGDNTVTKGFHQLAFASEYAVLVNYLQQKQEALGIENFNAETSDGRVDVYDIQGRVVRRNVSKSAALNALSRGLYVIGDKKYVIR